MVYDKEYYEKNREKIKQQQAEWNKKHRDTINKTRAKWRKGKGKEKNRLSKQKSDNKYYAKMKDEPIFQQKRIDYMKKYNAEHKQQQKKSQQKHRAKPEVKKRNAEYNKKYHEENPEKALASNKRRLKKLGEYHNLKWYQLDKQLRGWAQIIHKDNKETCQVCGLPSQEAHHIIHKNKYPELIFNRNNGIALCIRCHNQVHGKRLAEPIT